MSESSTDSMVAAARAYENLHVPALFKEQAEYVLAALAPEPAARVLDVACGTGVLARTVAAHQGDAASVTGLDPNAGMLAVAAELGPDVEWREGVAEALPFADATFDCVVSQFGLMFFTDRVQALREMIRVLRTGGRLAVAVWDSLEHTPAYDTAVDLLRRMAGDAAADALAAPFVLGDRDELVALFDAAGCANARVTTMHGTARFPALVTMVEADLRGWLPVMGVELEEHQIEEILAAAEGALKQFVTADGTVEFDSPAHIVVATRPA